MIRSDAGFDAILEMLKNLPDAPPSDPTASLCPMRDADVPASSKLRCEHTPMRATRSPRLELPDRCAAAIERDDRGRLDHGEDVMRIALPRSQADPRTNDLTSRRGTTPVGVTPPR